MKKKMVVRMPLGSEKSRRKAMRLAVKVRGVASATVDKDKGQVTIIGEDVDPVDVVKMLKRRSKLRKVLGCCWADHAIGCVDLVTVEDVKDDKKDEKKPDEKKPDACPGYYNYGYGAPVIYAVTDSQPGGWWW